LLSVVSITNSLFSLSRPSVRLVISPPFVSLSALRSSQYQPSVRLAISPYLWSQLLISCSARPGIDHPFVSLSALHSSCNWPPFVSGSPGALGGCIRSPPYECSCVLLLGISDAYYCALRSWRSVCLVINPPFVSESALRSSCYQPSVRLRISPPFVLQLASVLVHSSRCWCSVRLVSDQRFIRLAIGCPFVSLPPAA
jgi:hypothetical protein